MRAHCCFIAGILLLAGCAAAANPQQTTDAGRRTDSGPADAGWVQAQDSGYTPFRPDSGTGISITVEFGNDSGAPVTPRDSGTRPTTMPPRVDSGAAPPPLTFPDAGPRVADPNNPPECPAEAPANPIGDCTGLPVYVTCNYGSYICVCDWVHWLCI